MEIAVAGDFVTAFEYFAHAVDVIVRPASADKESCLGLLFPENIENFKHVVRMFVDVEH